MYAYVINLARSPERRVHIAAELQRVGIAYEFVAGVDGGDLELADNRVIDPSVLNADWFHPGVAGCAFSHLRVYEKILADNLDCALVLEDDALLPNDLTQVAEKAAEQLTGAEIALLSPLSTVRCKMSRSGAIRLSSSRQLVLPIDVNDVGCSAGYIITRDACKRMIERIVPFQARPDDWGHFFSAAALDRVRCVIPPAVRQSPGFTSTIIQHDQNDLKSRFLKLEQRRNMSFLNPIFSYRRARYNRRFSRFVLVDEPFVVKPSRLD